VGAVIKAVNNTELLEKEWNNETISRGDIPVDITKAHI
jgi:hypothetical protein